MGHQQELPIKYYGGGSHGFEVGLMTAEELKGRFLWMTTISKDIRKLEKVDNKSY